MTNEERLRVNGGQTLLISRFLVSGAGDWVDVRSKMPGGSSIGHWTLVIGHSSGGGIVT
jgi:hypothetical protein